MIPVFQMYLRFLSRDVIPNIGNGKTFWKVYLNLCSAIGVQALE